MTSLRGSFTDRDTCRIFADDNGCNIIRRKATISGWLLRGVDVHYDGNMSKTVSLRPSVVQCVALRWCLTS